jgi:hypothetical protein
VSDHDAVPPTALAIACRRNTYTMCRRHGIVIGFRVGLLHVDMFPHNKSGIAYRDRSQRPETVAFHKHHQQPRLLPSCTK